MTTTYTTTQVMMTLSGLAAFSPAPRPSGESVASQRDRIFNAIQAQLQSGSLATGSNWDITWLGLTDDRANLAYIALDPTDAMLALVLRGTIGGSPIDSAEDLDVGTLLPFADGGGGNISQGSMEAFTEIVNVVDPATGLSLYDALQQQLITREHLTLYVTGHSLGGAMATTLALYLDRQPWTQPPAGIFVYTFAAPTAGDVPFATQFNHVFPQLSTLGPNPTRGYVGTWNQYDVVPSAWWNLLSKQGNIENPNPVEDFFPAPGPFTSPAVKTIIKQMYEKTAGNVYAHPALDPALNPTYETHYDTNGKSSIACWLAELGYQHANNTYLGLILNEENQSAPLIPSLTPAVSSLSPAQGPYAAGTVVTIDGSNFTDDCVVDFGVWPASSTTLLPSGQLQAVAPAGAGIVNVTVTNNYGTSATKPETPCYAPPAPPDSNPSAFCQFTYTPPSS